MKTFKQEILNTGKIIILALVIGLGANYILADFTAPISTPPTCVSGNPGCDAPLNVSGTGQIKTGGLTLGTGCTGPCTNGLIVFAKSTFNGAVQIATGAAAGKVLTSDATGNAAWTAPAVSSIVAGHGIAVSPTNGTGNVTVSNVTTPDYDSGWVDITTSQQGTITHNLGTNRFSNFQVILRDDATHNDEMTFSGMNVGMTEFSSPTAHYGIQFYVSQASNPLNTIKYNTADTGLVYGATSGTAVIPNWTRVDAGTHALNSGQIDVRIWK